MSDLITTYGQPTFTEFLDETGGRLVIFSQHPGNKHLVFELGASGKIVKATEVK